MNCIEKNVVERDEMAKQHAPEKRALIETIEPALKKRPCSDHREVDTHTLPFYLDPKKSRFYLCFVSEQQKPYVPFLKLFGLPQSSYFRLLLDVKRHDKFRHWYNENHNSEKEPIELLLLGFLKVLSNAKYRCTEDMEEVVEDVFYDVSDMTHIEPEMLHQFFHYFLFEGFTSVYRNYVHGSSFVVTADRLEHLNNFVKAGLFGVHEAKMTKRIREIRQRPL